MGRKATDDFGRRARALDGMAERRERAADDLAGIATLFEERDHPSGAILMRRASREQRVLALKDRADAGALRALAAMIGVRRNRDALP
jgi:hypothetical protein